MTAASRAQGRFGLRWACLILAAALGGCAQPPHPPSAPATAARTDAVQSWLTTGDQTKLLQQQADIAWMPSAAAPADITVDPAQRFQVMAGFGASLTDASAWLIQHRMSPAQREALLRDLFTQEQGGAGFDLLRLTIGASDFSRTHYSLADQPLGRTDPPLASFSIDANRAEVLPVVQHALALNPRLQVMASPWSAPGWMKTTDSLIKGSLKPEHEETFARYLVRYVQAYRAEGVPIFALTIQNEPHFEPDDYPGMRVEAAQRARIIGRYLGPMLRQQGLNVQIIDWDHNWDEPQSPLAVLADPVARPYVDGVGWHCYADVKHQVNQTRVRDAHPDKDVWFTECSGGAWAPHWPQSLPWVARHIVIGATRGWARGLLMWNLALDENHGPHRGGCKDCRGVVTIDSRTGEVTRNLEYYALAHASRFVRPGARRIASTAGEDGIDTVAFRHEDDGSVVLVVCNSAAQARRLTVREGARAFTAELPRESVATWVWPGSR